MKKEQYKTTVENLKKVRKELYRIKVDKLKIASNRYHNGYSLTMTDSEYDMMVNECRAFENDNPNLVIQDAPYHKVGASIENGKELLHITRMTSQKDIFTIAEVVKWLKSRKLEDDHELYLEYKLDGCSLNIYYEDGKLNKLITRGDGEYGRVITDKAKYIKNIPMEIIYKKPIEIRGEAIISNENFNSVSSSKYTLARSYVSGMLNLLDLDKFKDSKIEFIPWGIGYPYMSEEDDLRLDKNKFDLFFKDNGFDTIPFKRWIKNNIESIETTYKRVVDTRYNNDINKFPIDGLMIYINNYEKSCSLGIGNRYPNYSCAFKLPPVEVSTYIRDIITQVGKTGKLTPVALIDTVTLSGSKISRVTLSNFNTLFKLGTWIGSKVSVYKSGDIIPAIKQVLYEDTFKHTYIAPRKCSECKSILKRVGTEFYCVNNDCKGILKSKIKYAISKRCLNINKLGPDKVVKLIEDGTIRNLLDFYRYISGIIDIKSIPFNLLLESLSIEGVGKTYCKSLVVRGIDSFDKVLADTSDKIKIVQEWINNNKELVNWIDKERATK